MAVGRMLNASFKFLLVVCISAVSTFTSAQLKVSTVAGGFQGNGGPATSAAFASPVAVALDKKGKVYIGESLNCQIRRVNSTSVISAYAGSKICGFSGDGGPASNALFSGVTAMAFDSHGNLFVSDSINARVRKIDSNDVVTTFAGSGTFGNSGNGGPATQASIGEPHGIAIAAHNKIYFSDSLNVVHMVDSAGVIHTVAGNGTFGFSGDNGPATAAQFSTPEGVAIDSNGNLYIADEFNNRVRKVDTTGTITTFAGNGINDNSGSGGPATSAGLSTPIGLVVRGNTLYISTFANLIWTVDLNTQIINIVAGNGTVLSGGFNGDGNTALSTSFFTPQGMTFDSVGNLIVADSANNRIRVINQSQIVSTLAGGFVGDGGQATDAALNTGFNSHIALDAAGNLYIADAQNARVRKVTPGGVISTFAGTGISGFSGNGGPASSAMLSQPKSVTVDSQGNVYIADTGNFVVRKVDTNGIITTLGSPGPFGFLSSLAPGMVTDNSGNLFVTDGLSVVWELDSAGNATLFAGLQFQGGYNGDGIPANQAMLNFPCGLARDQQGNIYIAEFLGNRIRKVDTSGIISTIAGNGLQGFSGDGGPATSAMLSLPLDVGVDRRGNVYIADFVNERIRMIDGSGTIQTIAGSGGFGYNGNNLAATSTNLVPTGVAVKPNGTVFFADEDRYLVRKVH